MLKISAAAALAAIALAAGGPAAARAQRPTGPPPLPSGPLTVTGTITHHGEPVAGARLTFVLFEAAVPRVREVTTDARGNYQMVLDPRGGYRVALRLRPGDRDVAQSELRLFMNDVERFDWAIRGAIITVRLDDWDGSPAAVTVVGRDGREVRNIFRLNSRRDSPASLFLLPGDYTISAAAVAGGAASARVPIVVREETAAVPVALTMRARRSWLTFRDDRGNAITDVSDFAVSLSPARTLPADAHGRIDLSRASPGDQLRITLEGYAPTCRTVPEDDRDVTVTLRSGPRKAHLSLDDDILKGRLFSSEPGDCGVPLSSILTRRSSTERRLEFDNFPTGPGYVVVTAGGTADIAVADDGRIAVTWRKR